MSYPVRRAIAAELSQAVEVMACNPLSPSIATDIHLLKSKLASAHKGLAQFKSENNFVSIITLAEAYLAQWTWKEYTPSRLKALREMFVWAKSHIYIEFEDCERFREQFRRLGMQVSPIIPVDSSEATEEDEEVGEADLLH